MPLRFLDESLPCSCQAAVADGRATHFLALGERQVIIRELRILLL